MTTTDEAIEAISEAIKNDPELKELADEVKRRVVDPLLSGQLNTADVPAVLQEMVTSPDGVLFQPDGLGLPGLNPLVQAALAERLQFDGDIPEMRTGPLPDEAMPAVPVDLDTLDAAQLGLALREASMEVKASIEAKRAELVSALTAEGGTSPTVGSLMLLESPDLEPDGYKRGEDAPLRKVPPPTPSRVALLSPPELSELSWNSYATTQGRKSTAHVLEAVVRKDMEAAGYTVSPGKAASDCVFSREWTMKIEDRNNANPKFSPANLARVCFVRSVLAEVPMEGRFRVSVGTLDRISTRTVGWTITVSRDDD